MRSRTTYFLRSGMRVAAISATLCFSASAQVAATAPGTTSTTGTETVQAPDSAPTAVAAPSPPRGSRSGEPTGQQPAPQDQQPAIAPETSADDSGRFVFKKQVQEVVLHATVVDEAGHLVTSLGRDAFSVFVNGVPEPITSFRREDVPVAMGIVIDNSGSMRDKRDKVNQAVLNLIRASNPQDEIFVVNFGQTPYLDQDFTSDVNLLQTALHQVSSRGTTALYDAVVASAIHLREQSPARQESASGDHRRPGQYEPGDPTGSRPKVAAQQGCNLICHRAYGEGLTCRAECPAELARVPVAWLTSRRA